MKKLLAILSLACLLAAPVSFVTTGCTTSQQSIVYQTLYSTEQSTTAAYDAYLDYAIKNNVALAKVTAVSKTYNDFQTAMRLAVVAAKGNTSAIAPPSVTTAAANVTTAINLSK